MAEAYRFESAGFPGEIAGRCQNAVRFLNDGGDQHSQAAWEANRAVHLEALKTSSQEIGRQRRTNAASLQSRLQDLVGQLEAQSAVALKSFTLLALETAWTPEQLDTADERIKKLFHKHFLAKKLKERRVLDQLERALLAQPLDGTANDAINFQDAWRKLFQTYRNINRPELLEPCLKRAREMLIQMWPALIDPFGKASEALLKTSWEQSQCDRAQLLHDQLTSAIERFEGLSEKPSTNTDVNWAKSLIEQLKDRIASFKEQTMSRPTDAGLGPTPTADDASKPDNVVPINRAAHVTMGGIPARKESPMTIDPQHQKMDQLATAPLDTPERAREALILADPFIKGEVTPANDIEKKFLERVENFRDNTVVKAEQLCAKPDTWTKTELGWVMANKAVVLAALPFFRGDVAVQAMTKRIEREPLAFKANELLDLPDGSWNVAERDEATALLSDPLLAGTSIESELKSRLDLEARQAAARAVSSAAAAATPTPAATIPSPSADTSAAVAELVAEAQELFEKKGPWSKHDKQTADSLLRSSHLPEATRAGLQARYDTETKPSATTDAKPIEVADSDFGPAPVVTKTKGGWSSETIAAIVVVAISICVLGGLYFVMKHYEPDPAYFGTGRVATRPQPMRPTVAPTVTPAPVMPAPATPAAPSTSPAAPLRALTPADFGGNPVNRVPPTIVVSGSWARRHLRCSSPPVTDADGNVNYRGCQYQP